MACVVPPTVTTVTQSSASGLPSSPPSSSHTLHEASMRRVVLLGKPCAGKRTLCRHLMWAARATHARTRANDDAAADVLNTRAPRDTRSPTHTLQHGLEQQVLQRQRRRQEQRHDDDDDDGARCNEDKLYCSSSSSAEASEDDGSSRRAPDHVRNMNTRHDALTTAPHSTDATLDTVGIAHDYLTVSSATASVAGDAHVHAAPHYQQQQHSRHSTQDVQTYGFFCCDTAGALATALPTAQSLDEAVVIVVVDGRCQHRLQRSIDDAYKALRAHVTTLLHTSMPTRDEVHMLDLIYARRRQWSSDTSTRAHTGTPHAQQREQQQQQRQALRAALFTRSGDSLLLPPPSPTSNCVHDDKTTEFMSMAQDTTKMTHDDDDIVNEDDDDDGLVCPLPSMLACTRVGRDGHGCGTRWRKQSRSATHKNDRADQLEHERRRVRREHAAAQQPHQQAVTWLLRNAALKRCSAVAVLPRSDLDSNHTHAMSTIQDEAEHAYYNAMWTVLDDMVADAHTPSAVDTIHDVMHVTQAPTRHNTTAAAMTTRHTTWSGGDVCAVNTHNTLLLPAGVDAHNLLQSQRDTRLQTTARDQRQLSQHNSSNEGSKEKHTHRSRTTCKIRQDTEAHMLRHKHYADSIAQQVHARQTRRQTTAHLANETVTFAHTDNTSTTLMQSNETTGAQDTKLLWE